jgi:uncharacterized membrane protein
VKRAWLRRVLIAASILIYALLAHYSNGNPNARALGAALAVGPLLLALAVALRRLPHPLLAAMVATPLSAALLWLSWGHIERNFALMILLQQCGAYLTMALVFGRSLLRGEVPLCTHWATTVHGALSEEARDYTRAVTAAWTMFFVSISLLSAALYAWAPLWLWSVFSNFLTLPLAALMFLGEYALRQRLLPSMQRITLRDTARAYFQSPGGSAASRW